MKKILTLIGIGLVVGPTLQAQTVTGIQVTSPAPPAPITECDLVEITINGTFPASNYVNTGFIPNFQGFDLDYNLYAEQQGVGAPVITQFSEPVPSLGSFSPPGNYNLTIYFYNDSVLVDSFMTVLPVQMGVDPDPGSDTLIDVCTTALPFDLIDQLGGTPEPGGTWTDPNGNPHSGTFDPQSDPQGLYLYTLMANPPCNTTFSSVTIFHTPNTDPGMNGSAFICELDPPTDLFQFLGGTPVTGGTWTDPNGQPHTGMLDPGNDPEGNYKYTVPGVPPCGDPWAFVDVTLQDAANPGLDNSIIVADNDPPFMLFDHLGGNPDTNGTWVDPAGVPFGLWDAVMDPAQDFEGEYLYVAVSLPCPFDTAVLDVDVIVGIAEQDANISQLQIVPNPSNGQFRLDMQFKNAADRYELEIVNMTGQAVLKEALATSGRTSFQRDLDLTDLPKGVYFLRVASANATTVKRVVLE